MKRAVILVILCIAAIATGCNNLSSKNVSLTQEQIMATASRSEKNGWIVVHLEGAPEVVGFQHGYLLANEILDLRGAMVMLNEETTGKTWSFYRNESDRLFWQNTPGEYRMEIDGIVSGVNARLGEGKIDRKDIIAMNAILEMSWYYVPWLDSKDNPNPPDPTPPGHCSAIAATGSWTKDGK
ncbi:MAG: peptidase C45, partial [Odoribacter sp.]|nr:peptidase C45 [Odoribacter sp.]